MMDREPLEDGEPDERGDEPPYNPDDEPQDDPYGEVPFVPDDVGPPIMQPSR